MSESARVVTTLIAYAVQVSQLQTSVVFKMEAPTLEELIDMLGDIASQGGVLKRRTGESEAVVVKIVPGATLHVLGLWSTYEEKVREARAKREQQQQGGQLVAPARLVLGANGVPPGAPR